ncbi:hypothetical protein [Macrococcoides canis]|uniref:Uncharacterized protein n=1 Tax=Macrococcoides canis TaxID=1855823 RepID=A0A6G7ETK2_9STAP|nr:hypothetical protein [Macrococcus canis]MCO4097511.1 hypothetical protein [Macrococcus canis]QIH76659.1 hypothetical protein GTN31_10000 [Macrococcus canis]QIH79094.1 hypothetical protein GTN30_10605 [Macrococcus canis]QNR08616.1 hypothetical protein GL258_10350 [Macrococcus canis]QUR94994.1 hypothetical protein GOY09_08515 [Macrococcus canis]
MQFVFNLLQSFVQLLVHLGDMSITKSCYFYFNESELEQELFESKQ